MISKKSDSSSQFNFTKIKSQRELLLDKLKKRPVTTLQAREWGIMSPAARIMELREQGHDILTMKAEVTTVGCVRPVAEYVLLTSEKKGE